MWKEKAWARQGFLGAWCYSRKEEWLILPLGSIEHTACSELNAVVCVQHSANHLIARLTTLAVASACSHSPASLFSYQNVSVWNEVVAKRPIRAISWKKLVLAQESGWKVMCRLLALKTVIKKDKTSQDVSKGQIEESKGSARLLF